LEKEKRFCELSIEEHAFQSPHCTQYHEAFFLFTRFGMSRS
jgi:hypothetical protein